MEAYITYINNENMVSNKSLKEQQQKIINENVSKYIFGSLPFVHEGKPTQNFLQFGL